MRKPTNVADVQVHRARPRHPHGLIRVFAVHMKKTRVLSFTLNAKRRLLPVWGDAKADLSFRSVHIHSVAHFASSSHEFDFF